MDARTDQSRDRTVGAQLDRTVEIFDRLRGIVPGFTEPLQEEILKPNRWAINQIVDQGVQSIFVPRLPACIDEQPERGRTFGH